MTDSTTVRSRIVEMLRRDLIGPAPMPVDEDLQDEVLSESPSRWYLTGFIAPAEEEFAEAALDNVATQEEGENASPELDLVEDEDSLEGSIPQNDEDPEPPTVKRRFLPSSIGITVLLPASVTTFDVAVNWGDYVTEPPLPPQILMDEADGGGGQRTLPTVHWVRKPRRQIVKVSLEKQRDKKLVPESAAPQMGGGCP